MSRIGFPTMAQQDFVTMNRGDMFFPAGVVSSGDLLTTAGAAFNLTGGRVVHSIPVTYAMPTATVRSHAPIGSRASSVSANSIGGLANV